MKKILITGGAGYIGSHAVAELLSGELYDPIILDNFSNSNPKVIKRLEELSGKKILAYNRDCREDLTDIFLQHEIVGIMHFAAHKAVGESVEQPLKYYDNNINSLLNLLRVSQKFGVKNFVFSSSCSLYGNLKELPATEESPIGEPESPYAWTKLFGERILQDFSKANPETKIVSLRYFNPVGAHHSGLIGELIINKPSNIFPVICDSVTNGKKMMVFGGDYETRDGSCIRDYIHVSDVANAHVLSLEYLMSNNSKPYDVFNLGFNAGLSVLEIIKSFEEVNGVKVDYEIGPRRSGDVVQIYSDSKKAKEILGWIPREGIEEMVASAWRWHKKCCS